MKITCPSCDTSYEIAVGAMPAEGRKVRCARCGHRWHAVAVEEPEDDPETSPPADEREPEPAEDVAPAADFYPPRREDAQLVAAEMVDDPAERDEDQREREDREDAAPVDAAAIRAARRVRVQRRSDRRSPSHTIYGFVVGATLAMGVLAVQYRDNVVRSVPETAQLFRALGMEVNIRGLRFEALAPQRMVEDGVPTLVVEGKILNIRNEETEVPALHFVLRDASGDELYNWTIEPLQQALESGGELPFRTRLASPPADADAVELRFVDRTPSRMSMRP